MPTIREAVQAQADKLGLSAYAIAHESKQGDEFLVSVNHVQEYLSGRKDMTSTKLDAIFGVLGLEVLPKPGVKHGDAT